MNNFLSIAKQMQSCISTKLISPAIIRCTLERGLSYESFNPYGFVQPWSVLALCDMAMSHNLIPGIKEHSYLDLDKVPELASFYAAVEVTFNEEIYDLMLDKSKCDVQFSLTHIGRTSLTLGFDIFFPQFHKSVTTGRIKVVIINLETMKAARLPDWWVQKFGKFIPPSNSSLMIPRVSMPSEESLQTVSTVIQSSHIDGNLHIGWYSQVQLLLDAYAVWHSKQFGFDGNGGAYRNVKNLKLVYGKSVTLGDEMNVHFYPYPDDENKFQFFVLDKETKQMVTECRVDYYSSLDQEKIMSKL